VTSWKESVYVSFFSEVSPQREENNRSLYQMQAAVAASGCRTAFPSTCMSVRRRVEMLGSTARTRPQLHVRQIQLDDVKKKNLRPAFKAQLL